MKAVVQRVSSASVSVNGDVLGRIGQGLMVLLGISDLDEPKDSIWLAQKISNLRIFSDQEGKMNLSLKDIGGNALVISQFTLFASTKKGNRPSFIGAGDPEKAIPLYDNFLEDLGNELGKKVERGKFGAMMDISLVNSGPVTITIDTRNKE